MAYEPFLISDFKTALELDREPWLLPKDAFESFKNVFLRDGVIEKRRGFSEFADTKSSDAVVGIHNFIETDGTKSLLVNTIDRLYEYNSGTGALDDKSGGSDNWTGTVDNIVNSVNANGKIYMVNSKSGDGMQSYNGTARADVTVDISDDSNNDLNYAVHIFFHKERIILLNTSEDGTAYPQRARWSTTTDVEDFTNDGYVDCPTSEWIITAVPVDDDIIVFFTESVWRLRYTGNNILPFRWEKITSSKGATAEYSGVAYNDKAIALGEGGLIDCDGTEVVRIDERVPDLTLTMQQDETEGCFSILNKELRQIWLFYPNTNATANDRCLVFNYEDENWAIFDNMDFICAGKFTSSSATTWATATGTWAEQTEIWYSGSLQAGYPFILGGKSNGKIYRLMDGSDDDGDDISIEIISGRWNPYKKAGMAARLGYIDFLVSKNAAELSVDFYIDFQNSSYQTMTLDCDTDEIVDKHWIRLFSGAVGNSHRIKIYETASGTLPKIHAIMPHFAPVGRITK